MGHSGTSDISNMRTSSSQIPVFTAFKEHCSGKRTNTELTILHSIRAIHPDKHVTVVAPSAVNLLGYAKAGHAESTLVTDGDSFLASRIYVPPTSRLESSQGTLSDNVIWGHYEYKWEGKQFPVYYVEWTDGFQGTVRHCHVLSPRNEEGGDALHSPSADRLIKACGKWTSEVHDEIYVFDAGTWVKNKDLWTSVQSASWDDVILDPAMKQTLIDDVHSFFDSRALYQEYSVPWKRGIIFHGVPGCGKTISIKALMHSLQEKNVASLYVKSFDACQGMQHSIRAIFKKARTMAPTLLIFEDLDSLVKEEVRSYFLNEVDGLESNDGILMIGSTNHLDRLDPGIAKRPSRFDRKYHYQVPGHQERVLYCQYWRDKLEKHKSLGFTDEVCEIVAQLTEDFSFAYMKELFVQALLAIVGGRADAEDELTEVAVSDAAQTTRVVEESARLAKDGETTGSSSAQAAGAETKNRDENEDAPPLAREPRTVPEVEIPARLRDNALLRVLRRQVIALVKDMDNTADGNAPAKSKIPSDSSSNDATARRMARRAARGRG